MQYLQNIGVGFFFFISSILSGSLGFLHLSSNTPINLAAQPSLPTTVNRAPTARTQAPIQGTTAGASKVTNTISSTTTASSTSELLSDYGRWFAVQALPSYCAGNNPSVPGYPTVPAYGSLTVQLDGIYLDGAKLNVDDSSFEVFCERSGARNFWKDARQIYVDGVPFDDVDVDLASFTPLESGSAYELYAKDKYRAYATTQEIGGFAAIAGADVASFISDAHLYPFAKDDYRVYFGPDFIPGADPSTFEVIGTAHTRDKTHVYWYGANGGPSIVESIFGADVNSFEEPQTWGDYGKDFKHVYFQNEMCPQIDVATFVVDDANLGDGHDKDNFYSGCEVSEHSE